jgi:MFS family permease
MSAIRSAVGGKAGSARIAQIAAEARKGRSPCSYFKKVSTKFPVALVGLIITVALIALYPKEATAMMSTCIIAAQEVMLPLALLVGYKADTWGRKPLFLAGFAILPIRAVRYTHSNNSFWLIGVQLLDGIGAGIFGALAPLVIADIMRGAGRYNLAQGEIATVQGIGASLSGLAGF